MRRKGVIWALVLVMIFSLMPTFSNATKQVKGADFAITTPVNNTLKAAGHIEFKWSAASGTVKNYKLYVDNKEVVTTTKTTCEWYSTEVTGHTAYVKAIKNNGEDKTAEIKFYVSKKGLAVNDDMGKKINPVDMYSSWYYDWSMNPLSYTGYNQTQFVPMQWGSGNEANNINKAVNGGYRYFLGYNEPDMDWTVGGSNIPVATALANWPNLTGKDIHLGSPAPALCPAWSSGTWFRSFMEKVDQDSFEFIPLHCYYGTYGGAAAANTFLTEVVDGTYNMYHKPIWITEFAISGWGYNNVTARKSVKEFLEAVLKGLDERSYVERYSWFTFNTTDNNNGASALWTNSTGVLTELGEAYRDNGNPKGYDPYSLPQDPYKVKIENDKKSLFSGTKVINNVTCNNYALNYGVQASATSVKDNNKINMGYDNNIETRWESQHGVDDIEYILDLGSVKKVKEVDISWEGASASKYLVQVSNDGSNYTDVAQVESGAGVRVDTITLANQVEAKYIKLKMISRSSTYGYSFYELGVYGTDNAAVDATTQRITTQRVTTQRVTTQRVTTQRNTTQRSTIQRTTTYNTQGDVNGEEPVTAINNNSNETEVSNVNNLENIKNNLGKTKVKKAIKKNSSKKIKVSLKKVNNASGYQIQISKSKKFNKKNIVLKKTVRKLKIVKKAKFTLKGSKIKNKKKLWIRARAYQILSGNKIYGKWTRKKKVKVS